MLRNIYKSEKYDKNNWLQLQNNMFNSLYW